MESESGHVPDSRLEKRTGSAFLNKVLEISQMFILGTDTGIGKTFVTAGLVRALRRMGAPAAAMKPIASGIEATGLYADIEALRAASELGADQINLYRFAPPIAPHRAAQLAGVDIVLPPIVERHTALAARFRPLLVEGVGGVAVPLSNSLMQLDLVRALKVPTLLVVGLKLGCINHALLSAAAISAHGLQLGGWIGNAVDPQMLERDASVEAIARRIGVDCLGTISYQPEETEFDLLVARWRERFAPAQ